MMNSNSTISNSSFSQNIALRGAGIYFSCLGQRKCSLEISNSSFTHNLGVQSGGGLEYDVYRPTMENIKFVNNKAVYGPNIASYPVRIRVKETLVSRITLNDVGSGVSKDVALNLALFDHDNQTAVLDNVSQIEVRAVQPDTAVSGTTSVKVTAGVASFAEMKFTFKPGAQNVQYGLSSDGLDFTKIIKQYGSSYIIRNITVNFRYCKPGEIERSNTTCSSCSPGSYSLTWNATKCENCIEHADCLGEEKISLEKGFWRRTKNSTLVVECPNPDACLGGYSSTETHPVI